MMLVCSVFFLCVTSDCTVAVSSSLRILKGLNCSQAGLGDCRIDVPKVPRIEAPTGPDWEHEQIRTMKDGNVLVPVVNISWKLQVDGSIFKTIGSELKIRDEGTNQSVCVQFLIKDYSLLNPEYKRWVLSLAFVVEPGNTYNVTVFNIPEPEQGHYRITKKITAPKCDDKRIEQAQLCQENDTLWNPKPQLVVKTHSVSVSFRATPFSERYLVSVQSGCLSCSKNISKENRTLLTVTFEDKWCLFSNCEREIVIQPFFAHCRNECKSKNLRYCKEANLPKPLLTLIPAGFLIVLGSALIYFLRKSSHTENIFPHLSADERHPEVFKTERKRILLIYSLDHPLFKNVVLKFSAFLMARCGTDVVLDLLDSNRLGVLGGIQWLDWNKEQIERSSDKILILCSRGVQAKWRAMCGERRVFLREDARSPIGDMLTPSLALMVPHFVRSASFENYIVAYLDEISTEEDVPTPFQITVRYKLMEQFEEVFFRILNIEKEEPGRVKQIDGLSADKYYECPSGGALRDAIRAFRSYQLEHPQWFEEEMLESFQSDEEEAVKEVDKSRKIFSNHITRPSLHSARVFPSMETQSYFAVNKPTIQLTSADHTDGPESESHTAAFT